MNKNNKIQKIAENTYKNPITQASLVVIESVPVLGTGLAASRKALEQTYLNALADRKNTFLNELENGASISEEMLNTEEFIHSVYVTYNAALRTYQREKIRRFARILLRAIENDELATDKFEEYVKLLESISSREFDMLNSISLLEQSYIFQHKENYRESKHSIEVGKTINNWVLNITRLIWDEFVQNMLQKYNISRSQLFAMLARLEGMGLYSGGKAVKYEGQEIHNIGTSSFLFEDFREWVKLEDDKLNTHI